MQNITVRLKGRSYKIVVGYGIADFLGKTLAGLSLGTDAYVITNNKIKKKLADQIIKSLKKSSFNIKFKTVPDTEKSKSIETLTSVLRDLAQHDKEKKVFIIALGGGVIGDLSGFVASVYKRGIPYVQVPTTLLAQVDSAIGGKTAIDLTEGKNLVGAIYQPRLVFSDTKFLNSLDQRQIRAGLAEVIKYGIIYDRQLFCFLETRFNDCLSLKPQALEYIVSRASLIKADIVSCDEREEKGIRTILNFGHTVGHAIEAAANFKGYNHGESIALGMLVACGISKRLRLIDEATFCRVENLLKDVGLPLMIKGASLSNIINAHFHDKKFIGRKNRFVLINGIGKAKVVENIPLEIIKAAIRDRI